MSELAMEGWVEDWAVDALGALAHETRLGVFRLLVKAGPEGMIAGSIATRAGVPASTLSHHLATLERSGLVQSRRESRLIHYHVDEAGMRRLLSFLVQDCCQGEPQMCAGLIEGLNGFALDLVPEPPTNPASAIDTHLGKGAAA